jgi:hypothetical protein
LENLLQLPDIEWVSQVLVFARLLTVALSSLKNVNNELVLSMKHPEPPEDLCKCKINPVTLKKFELLTIIGQGAFGKVSRS